MFTYFRTGALNHIFVFLFCLKEAKVLLKLLLRWQPSVAREVVTFFTLPPGDYIVVPQTNVPNCDGKFLLRILTDEQSNIW